MTPARCPILPQPSRFVRAALVVATFVAANLSARAAAPAPAAILPIPQEVETFSGTFEFDPSVVIAIPEAATEHDVFLARSLAAEVAQRYGLALTTQRFTRLPAGKLVVIGTWQNPLVQAASREAALNVSASAPGAEGYGLAIQPGRIVIAGSDEAGAFYGLQSLRQLLMHATPALQVNALRIRDWPHEPMRAVKLYLPGRDNIAFYRRFIRDFAALYKYNQVYVEINGGMRFDRHPEINAGWIDMFRHLAATRRDRPTGPRGEFEDSPNQDVADGAVLEKEEVADLVSWTRRQHLDFIPEVPSLSHAYYLLTRHRELADPMQADWEWPDAYAAGNPAAVQLAQDVMDEVIEVTKPRIILIGHDEWRTLVGTTPQTNSEARGRQFIQDVRAMHDYLSARHIRTAMYGDHLIADLRGHGFSPHKTKGGIEYKWPGGLSAEQVQQEIPKDILISNWFWTDNGKGLGEQNEKALEQWGFQQVYTNMHPGMRDYGRRSAQPSIVGGVPASWAATTESNFGKDFVFDMLGVANELWSSHWPTLPEVSDLVQAEMPVIRRNFSGRTPPSHDEPVQPVALAAKFNASASLPAGLTATMLRNGQSTAGRLQFDLADPATVNGEYAVGVAVSGDGKTALPSDSAAIPVGVDASSLVFLHALAAPATNRMAYLYVYNFDDSADLLGHYEVVYDDGLVLTIPIRYGVNIAEWSWRQHKKPNVYCYGADAVEIGRENGQPVTFFALEWPNPRLGRVIKEVRLHGTRNFGSGAETDAMEATEISGARDMTVKKNTILLRALSIVGPRKDTSAVRAQPAPKPPSS